MDDRLTELVQLVKRMRWLQRQHAMHGNPVSGVLADIESDKIDRFIESYARDENVRAVAETAPPSPDLPTPTP